MKQSPPQPECKLVIAGPGAGKTHNMVQKVLDCMENLHPTRFCVVITYTNAATEEIKSRLAQQGKIPTNVFVGTIHSFLNQFIFEPYAKIKGIVKGDYILIDSVTAEEPHEYYAIIGKTIFKGIEGLSINDSKKIYIELQNKYFISKNGVVTKKFKANVNLNLSTEYASFQNEILQKIISKKADSKARDNKKRRDVAFLAENLVGNSIITYDKLLEKTKQLIEDSNIAKIVANRLEYVFVDEYQDIRLWQHEVFMKIFEQGKTNFYCIGDPLQSIFNFSYIHSQNSKEKAPEKLNDTPIFLLEKKYGRSDDFEHRNHRSRPVILNFVHNYMKHIKLEQATQRESTDVPIYFINLGKDRKKSKGVEKDKIDLITKKEILFQFNSIIDKHKITKETDKIYKLLLLDEWNTIKPNEIELSSKELPKKSHIETSYFQEISRYIRGIVGYKLSEIQDKKSIESIFKYRTFCIRQIKNAKGAIENHRIKNIQDAFIKEYNMRLGENIQNIEIKMTIENLNAKQEEQDVENNEPFFYSTIHSAKGLEATCVLVIAKTQNELETWLEFEKSHTSTKDNHRLGYVAFSRARELLCIACLETIDENLAKKIIELKFETLPKNN